MSTRDITKAIQTKVGVANDGIYGQNTAIAIIRKLGLTNDDLKVINKIIQKKVDSFPDGIYGINTATSIAHALGLKTQESDSSQPTNVNYKYSEVFKPTPNVNSYRIKPEGVVLHHSYGSYESAIDWILRSESNVSYHCIIDVDGSRTSFADDDRRCWHAGKSSFMGRSSCNGFLLGLAFTGDTNTRELNKDEIASALEWLLPRFEKWGWPKDLSTITTHREISPNRKNDVDSRAEQAILKALKQAL